MAFTCIRKATCELQIELKSPISPAQCMRPNRNYWWLQNQFRFSFASYTIVAILVDWLVAVGAPGQDLPKTFISSHWSRGSCAQMRLVRPSQSITIIYIRLFAANMLRQKHEHLWLGDEDDDIFWSSLLFLYQWNKRETVFFNTFFLFGSSLVSYIQHIYIMEH